MSISENIKELRKRFGLTQAQLGDIAGVSDKAVWTWENGTAEPRMGAIQNMADYFNIKKSDIVDDSPEDGIHIPSDQESELVCIFNDMNEEGQSELLKLARLLAASEQYKKHCEPELVEA